MSPQAPLFGENIAYCSWKRRNLSTYVIWGNRRLWALQQYVLRQGDLFRDGSPPKVRIIVHEFPCNHLLEHCRNAFKLKALQAMSSHCGGHYASMGTTHHILR